MPKIRRLVQMVGGALGFALIGVGVLAAPAQADPDVTLGPSCSVRTADYVTAGGACANPSSLYEYRFTIFCVYRPAEGGYWDYAVVSPWRPTTDAVHIGCDSGGWIAGTLGPELRPRVAV
jgi:hypothetical protein